MRMVCSGGGKPRRPLGSPGWASQLKAVVVVCSTVDERKRTMMVIDAEVIEPKSWEKVEPELIPLAFGLAERLM